MCRLFKSDDEAGDETTEDAALLDDEEQRKDSLVYDVQDILHMLTPGMEVLGTFVVCSSDDVVADAKAWDRVKLVYRVVRKLCPDAGKHYVLVHSTTGAGKTSCKLVVGDKANLDKCELKAVTVEFSDRDAYKLVQLNAQFSLTRSHFLRSFDWAGNERGQMKVKRLREMMCGGLEKTLTSALITFNGEIAAAKQKIQDVAISQTDVAGGDPARGKVAPIVVEIYEKNVSDGKWKRMKKKTRILFSGWFCDC